MNAMPNVHKQISYSTGSWMWYAAYSRTTLLRAVQVPKVRAERGVTGLVLFAVVAVSAEMPLGCIGFGPA